jgi:hypothetical protein
MRSSTVLGFTLLTFTTLHTESALAARYLRQSAFDCRPIYANLTGGVEELGPSTSYSVKNAYSDHLLCVFPGTSRFSHNDVTGINVHGSSPVANTTISVCRGNGNPTGWPCNAKDVPTTGNWTVTFSSSEIPPFGIPPGPDYQLWVVVSLPKGGTLRGVFYSAP